MFSLGHLKLKQLFWGEGMTHRMCMYGGREGTDDLVVDEKKTMNEQKIYDCNIKQKKQKSDGKKKKIRKKSTIPKLDFF